MFNFNLTFDLTFDFFLLATNNAMSSITLLHSALVQYISAAYIFVTKIQKKVKIKSRESFSD